ncbi:lanthionine synthetase LanC family protein [Mucilaginibacter ginsenosidivorax]|uniref:Protein kinase n=1 Tax=Mucilaginibacter ginsenosidivorax TaxID=862126 RepID=A0A5B8W7D5_9SPHI|nr:lanthionine synthetase LanC family protein [Mucilaginibacter ginsenosidivorax]QEC78855.1 protein kinase [Mucilaginibacter ginsenosidivorax]
METSAIPRTDQVNSGTKAITGPGLNISSNWDYEAFFKTGDVKYHIYSPYIIVEHERPYYGWVLYLSVIRQQAFPLFNLLIPKLLMAGVSFEIPESGAAHSSILDGSLGYEQIGKVICIYPYNDENALLIAKDLIELTRDFAGPVIPTAIHLRSIVYTGINHGEGLNFSWPFYSISKPLYPKTKKWLKKYFIVQQLKGDAKGNVYKCLNVTRWTNIHWCVIKQGLAYQCADDFGRTIKDRLEWQYDLLKYYEGKIPLPKALEYFEQQGNAYLVTEFIESLHLYDKIHQLHQGTMWSNMPVEAKRALLKILLDVVAIVDLFHDKGLVHRDISPGNFLVREDGTVVAIDIELIYDYRSNRPKPPYTLGTPGYISPQQIQFMTPNLEDDYYGLGGLMVKIFTGMSPSKFQGNDEESIFKAMKFFTSNNAIASLVSSCLAYDPALRPNINSIRHTLLVYDALLLTNLNEQVGGPQIKIHSEETKEIKEVIQKGINAFAHPIMIDQFGHWIGKTAITDGLIANELYNCETAQDFANGTAGVLYMLANAEKLGFDLGSLNSTITRNLERLSLNSDRTENDDTGLFYGSPGKSVAICAMVNAGLLEKTIHFHNQIYKGLSKHDNGVNLATGVAGRGLAMLYCASRTNQRFYYPELNSIVSKILKEQQTDGSWLIKQDHSDYKGIKILGFSYGIAGIVYFLMMHYSMHNDLKVKQSILKALFWLLKQRVSTDVHMVWPLNSTNGVIDPWFENGFSGVAFTFIKAYEIFKNEMFKEAASEALKSHPQFISSNYITMNNGLSGLGQVYIEALKIFEDDEWKERARYIVYYFMNCCKTDLDKITYWHEENYTRPSAGYLNGNAGIINFLMHYLYPNKIELPF